MGMSEAELRLTRGRDAVGEVFADLRLFRRRSGSHDGEIELTPTAAGVRIPARLIPRMVDALQRLEPR
jgi:hypothetical protein